MAAVYPAGPDPTMITSRTFSATSPLSGGPVQTPQHDRRCGYSGRLGHTGHGVLLNRTFSDGIAGGSTTVTFLRWKRSSWRPQAYLDARPWPHLPWCTTSSSGRRRDDRSRFSVSASYPMAIAPIGSLSSGTPNASPIQVSVGDGVVGQ